MLKKYSVFIILLFILVAIDDFIAQEVDKKYITLQFDNKPLREILETISNQANVKFVYSDELINAKQVKCNLEKVDLEQALNEILTNTNIYFTFISSDTLIALHKNINFDDQTKKVTIRGKIIDKASNMPLPYVNVFLANTTLGDVSDDSGEFIIPKVTPGSYELIASMMGYEIQKKAVRISGIKETIINFELTPKVLPGKEVTVTAKYPKEWKKNLKIFEKIFFGKKEFAKKCELKNPEVLDFRYNKESGQFKAFSEGGLIFVNDALGYEVTIFLEEFYAELFDNDDIYMIDGREGMPLASQKGTFRCISFAHFKELNPKNEKEERKWEKNRMIAYNGSQRHFFISLINENLEKEGFKICGTRHFGSKNEQPLTKKDILKKTHDDKLYLLSYPDYLKVTYSKETDEMQYKYGMQRIGQMQGSNYNAETNLRLRCLVQTSWIKVIKGIDILINKDGIVLPNGTEYTTLGYWRWDSISEILPYNYKTLEN